MNDAWAVVVAGLGSSALTGLVALAVSERQSSHRKREIERGERRRAYSSLLASSWELVELANGLHNAIAIRSGLIEGLDVALRVRDPVDPLELAQKMITAQRPLMSAWSEIWTIGSNEAIELGNELVTRCARVLSVATERGKGRSTLARFFAGEKWTLEQLGVWGEEVRRAGEARRALALCARRELGAPVAEVFVAPPQIPQVDPEAPATPELKVPHLGDVGSRTPSPLETSTEMT